jgi:hypothetical protein
VRKLFIVLGLIAAIPSVAQTATLERFCKVEFGGDVHYNEGSKRWEGTGFKPGKGFVLRLLHLKTEEPTPEFPFKRDKYAVQVTNEGENHPLVCYDDHRRREAPWIGSYLLNCTDGVTIWINLKNNRFVMFSLFVYADGKDKARITPTVYGGKCFKIE